MGSHVQTPMHALEGMFPMPPQEFIRLSMYLPQALPVSIPCKVWLYSHTPSNELWFAVVSGNSPWRSESPCPRTITGGGDCGDGEQVGRLGASSAEWEGRWGTSYQLLLFDVLVELQTGPRGTLGKGLGGHCRSLCSSYPSAGYIAE